MDQGKPSWWGQEPGEPPREAESDTAGPATDSDASAQRAAPAAGPEDAGPPPGYDPEVDQLRRVRRALREWRDGEDDHHGSGSRPETVSPAGGTAGAGGSGVPGVRGADEDADGAGEQGRWYDGAAGAGGSDVPPVRRADEDVDGAGEQGLTAASGRYGDTPGAPAGPGADAGSGDASAPDPDPYAGAPAAPPAEPAPPQAPGTGSGPGAENADARPWEVGVRPYPGAADTGAGGAAGGREIPAAVSAVAGARAGRAALPQRDAGDDERDDVRDTSPGTPKEGAGGPQDAAGPAQTPERAAGGPAPAPGPDGPAEAPEEAPADAAPVEDDDTTQLAVISDADPPPATGVPGPRRPGPDAPAAAAAGASGRAGDDAPHRPEPGDTRRPPPPGPQSDPQGSHGPHGPGTRNPAHSAPAPGGAPAPAPGAGQPVARGGHVPPAAGGQGGPPHFGGPGAPGPGPYATAGPYGHPQGAPQGAPRYDPWAPAHAAHGAGARERRKGRWATLVGALVIALVAGGIGGAIGSYIERNGTPGHVELDQSAADDGGGKRPPGSVAGIARSALPGVVTLRVSGVAEQSTGTGFVLDKRGHILTNNHVVQPAEDGGEITVTFSGGESKTAEVVGGDAGYDLAVVRVKGVSGLKPLRLGNSRSVAVGDPVVAIGAPYDLPNTVTSGIISAKERPITAGGGEGDGSDVSYVNALQTDAPINPGNSGGPLLDAAGRVIGINSAIRGADNGSGDPQTEQGGSIGLGFAIPVNKGAEVAEQLINTGKATHPVIGVTLNMQYTGDGAQVGTTAAEGGTEPVTPGGPADTAGIEPGDVITGVDGEAVHNGEELIVKIRSRSPGDDLSLTVERDGEELTVDLTLGEGEPAD